MAEIRLTQPSRVSPIFPGEFVLVCLGNAQPTTLLASDLIWKHLSSLSSSSPASTSSTSSSSSSSSFLLFTTSTHAQLLSNLVLSASLLFAHVYVPFYYISTLFSFFLWCFIFFSFRRFHGSVTRALPRAGEVPLHYGSLA